MTPSPSGRALGPLRYGLIGSRIRRNNRSDSSNKNDNTNNKNKNYSNKFALPRWVLRIA